MKRWAVLFAIAASGGAIPAAAPSQAYGELAAARRAGQVGERYDGYLGMATAALPAVQRQVSAINIRRRSLYVDLWGGLYAAGRRLAPPPGGTGHRAAELLRLII
jgi:uncharacterized protein YdbL (DUF1318 family)